MFDYTIFWILGIVIAVVGLVFGVAYLQKNNLISKENLLFVSTILGIGVEVLDEMNLKNEKDILKISSIIQDSLNFAVGMFDNTDDTYNKACEYAFNLCEQASIELTDNRKNIIEQLIKMSLEVKVINE